MRLSICFERAFDPFSGEPHCEQQQDAGEGAQNSLAPGRLDRLGVSTHHGTLTPTATNAANKSASSTGDQSEIIFDIGAGGGVKVIHFGGVKLIHPYVQWSPSDSNAFCPLLPW